MPNNLQRLLLYAILSFLIALTVPLYHIVEQHILEQKDLNKVHFTSGEHLAIIPRQIINVCIKFPHLPLQVNITVFSADHNSQKHALVNPWDL